MFINYNIKQIIGRMKVPQKTECSLQNLITMDMDEAVYRRYIHDVKSPFQVLQLELTSASEGFSHKRSAVPLSTDDIQRQHVSSFVVGQREGMPLDLKQSMQENERSRKRKRVPIFDQSYKQQKSFWPSLCNALGSVMCGNQTWYKPQIAEKKKEKWVSTIPKLSKQPKLQQPILNDSLNYSVSNLPRYESQFVQFLLLILPKLFLKTTISNRICAEKSEVLQALLSRLQSQDKYKVLLTMFSSDNIKRVDKRLNTQNLTEFLSEVVDLSQKPLKKDQQQVILKNTEKVIEILSEVQNDIREYLQGANRAPELQLIYNKMIDPDPRPKKLITLLRNYLCQCEIMCSQNELKPLEYIWKELNTKFYTKQQFVEQLTRNDYILRNSSVSEEGELIQQLRRLGYKRNES